jgi:hypothetical protein
MTATSDTRPRQIRQQAHEQAEEARARMDARIQQQDEGLTGWLNKRAGEWELSAPGHGRASAQAGVPAVWLMAH